LRSCGRLEDPFLVETARTASQKHLLAISQRVAIGETITEVLIERGDRIVALSTVNNAGARFSDAAHRTLVERAKDDTDLAISAWSRADIPHQKLLQLFSVASDNVRLRLEAADRSKAQFIRDLMTGVANEAQDQMRAHSPDYVEAQRQVAALHRAGELSELSFHQFATARQFHATTVALSIMCDLPIGTCERAMTQDRPELILMLARATRLSWDTVRAILRLRAGEKGMSPADLEAALISFTKLKHETALKALQFLRVRERAAASQPDPTGYQ
jgi:uncharacterized protein (DUF2336 family)